MVATEKTSSASAQFIMADSSSDTALHSSTTSSPSKVNNIQNEDSIEISTRAYVKMVLHVAKYPHALVNGVLLAKIGQQKSNQRLVVIDSIPLFHQTEGLSPMTEVALTQIETRAASVGMIIAGYYHANRLFKGKMIFKRL